MDQILDFLRRPKLVNDLGDWVAKPTNSNFLQCEAPVLTTAGVSIPGLTVCIQVRTTADPYVCNETYGLYQLDAGKIKYPVFRIDVKPLWLVAHREEGREFYGPHINFGHRVKGKDLRTSYSCGPRYRKRWLKRFCLHTNIDWSVTGASQQLSLEL